MEIAPQSVEGVSIGALAARTHVPVDTLRAWERRYGVLRPWRTDGGQRRYGAEDIERVLWLAARVAEGQRISEAVSGLTALSTREVGTETLPVDSLISRISASARQGDSPRMEAELDRAFAALPFVQTMELVIYPALAGPRASRLWPLSTFCRRLLSAGWPGILRLPATPMAPSQ